jgi:hypothetical protein
MCRQYQLRVQAMGKKVARGQDSPVTEISESRDDERIFIETFVYPGGDLQHGTT